MRKLREDSTWNLLTKEQRETLETWLFEENLGYKETLVRENAKITPNTAVKLRRISRQFPHISGYFRLFAP